MKLGTAWEQIKTIKMQTAIYPALFGLFILLAGICFTFSAVFLSQQINLIFSLNEDETQMLGVHFQNYFAVAGKLGLSTSTEETVPLEAAAPESASSSAASTQAAAGSPGIPTARRLASRLPGSTPASG